MEKYCDLHTHSSASDGTEPPAKVPRAALKAGLSAVALTDHNTVEGLLSFRSEAEKLGIEPVCGTEFTCDYNGTELHLLGLFLKEEHFGSVSELLMDVRKRKERSNEALAESLRNAGYDIDYEKIKASAGDYVNRAHFATEMMEKGYADTMEEAMKKYLSPEAGHYIPPVKLKALDVISFIRELGAVPGLAHPFLNLSEKQLLELIPDARRAGLCGMETDYSEYSDKTTALAREIADREGLLRSGGSDWHGKRKPHIAIGKGTGNLAIPYSYFEKLRDMAKK